MSVTLGGEPQSHPAWDVEDILVWMLSVLETVDLPEVALFGVNEADGGVLLIGVRGAELGTLTGKVFKHHTHCHWVSVCRRHRALNGFICFPKKWGKHCNRTSCDVYKNVSTKLCLLQFGRFSYRHSFEIHNTIAAHGAADFKLDTWAEVKWDFTYLRFESNRQSCRPCIATQLEYLIIRSLHLQHH